MVENRFILEGAAGPHERNGRAHHEPAAEVGGAAGVLALAKNNLALAMQKALVGDTLAELVRLAKEAPAELERFCLAMKEAGATTRDVDALRRAVKQECKRARSEAVRGLHERVQEAMQHEAPAAGTPFSNYYEEQVASEDDKVTVVRIGYPVQAIRDDLLRRTGGWPKRVGPALFAPGSDGKPLWLDSTAATFAYIGSKMPGGGANLVRWVGGADKVTEAVFDAHLRQTVEDFVAVEAFPHYPKLARHFYLHSETRPSLGGSALGELLERFNPATPVDRDLILAFLLSLVWGGLPGQRPAFLFTSDEESDENGRGAGKSTVPKLLSRLVGDYVSVTPNEPMDKLITRLLSSEALSKRVVLLDNVKALRFSWSELEGQITSSVISGRELFVGEGRRPNTLIWVITLNGASLSKDMAQRCVIVKVRRPDYSATWEEETAALIESRRWEILGDLLAILQEGGRGLKRFTRWGAWEKGVLSCVGDPSECQRVIEERQGAVDDDKAEADLIRDHFADELERRGHRPADEAVVWIPSPAAANFVNEATGEKRPKGRACVYLGTVGVKELRRTPRGNWGRGWTWTGLKALPGQEAVKLNEY